MTQPCRNPFYKAIQREGITIAVKRPERAGPTRNPYYDRIAADGGVTWGGRAKAPRRPTSVHSVRIDPQIWKRVAAQAARERISTNEAVRQALLIWLRS
jgi:hypothetical protein